MKHLWLLGVIGVLVKTVLGVSITGQAIATCTYSVAGRYQNVVVSGNVCPATMNFN